MPDSPIYQILKKEETSTGQKVDCVYFTCPFCHNNSLEAIFQFNDTRVDYCPTFMLSLAEICKNKHLSILHLQHISDRTHAWLEKVVDLRDSEKPEVVQFISQTTREYAPEFIRAIEDIIAHHLGKKVGVGFPFVKYY